jgi:hypothetical protein
MVVKPVVHDSEEWREVQKSLKGLQRGQIEIEGRLDRYDDRQTAQHRANKEEISQMKLALYGEPGDDENVGLIRKMDRMLNYGSATVFWIRALAGILMLLLTGGGVYVAIHH